MLHEIAPHRYSNVFAPRPPKPDSGVFCFTKDKTLLIRADEPLAPVCVSQLNCPPAQLIYAFDLDERAYYLLPEPIEPCDGLRTMDQAALRACAPGPMVFACAVAGSLYRWYRANRYCGGCGAAMAQSKTERALICPVCGGTVYPKICPAVIVAVTDSDRLLLTRYANRPYRRWALIAGFNEIGESIEQTVHREVMEETGLRVKNLRFYKSQPWVLTDSLLMGFWAELDGSDQIRLDTTELAEGVWIPRGELPPRPNDLSLTGEMMERFRTEPSARTK